MEIITHVLTNPQNLTEDRKKNARANIGVNVTDVKADGQSIASADGVVTVDAELDKSSKNPVQNKVVHDALGEKINGVRIGEGSEPITPGDDGVVTIPTGVTVNDGKLTINVGSASAEFTANQASNVTVNIPQLAAQESGNSDTLVTTGEKFEWNSKYDLPSNGIPKSHLSQSVRDSLALADSSIQNVDDKADRVTDAVPGNFAGLDSDGNLTDSGSKAGDFATAAQGELADSSVQGISVNGGTPITPTTDGKVDLTIVQSVSLNGAEPTGPDASGNVDLTVVIDVDDKLSDSSTNPVQNKVVKAAIDGKVDKDGDKQLSTEDYTTAEKDKLEHIEAGAQVNLIEHIKLNNTELAPANKTVTIPVDDTLSENSHNPVSSSAVYAKTTALNTAITGITNQYVKDATVSNKTLTITKSSAGVETTVEFEGDVNKIEKIKLGSSELAIDQSDKSVTIPYAVSPSQGDSGVSGVIYPADKQKIEHSVQDITVNSGSPLQKIDGVVNIDIDDVLPDVDDDDLILSGNQSENTPIAWKKIVKDYVGDRIEDQNNGQLADENDNPIVDDNAVQLWVSYKNTEFGARRAYEDHTGANIHDTIAAIRQVPLTSTANTMLFNRTSTYDPAWVQWSQVTLDDNGDVVN